MRMGGQWQTREINEQARGDEGRVGPASRHASHLDFDCTDIVRTTTTSIRTVVSVVSVKTCVAGHLGCTSWTINLSPLSTLPK